MFKVTNISSNPLKVNNRLLEPNGTVEVSSVGDKLAGYESRGWLMIVEVKDAKKPDPQTPVEPKEAKQPEPKKQEDKK